jgi:hypothetical protein
MAPGRTASSGELSHTTSKANRSPTFSTTTRPAPTTSNRPDTRGTPRSTTGWRPKHTWQSEWRPKETTGREVVKNTLPSSWLTDA